jgi:hypothetical protein
MEPEADPRRREFRMLHGNPLLDEVREMPREQRLPRNTVPGVLWQHATKRR